MAELQRWLNLQLRQVCHVNLRSPLGKTCIPDTRNRDISRKAPEEPDSIDVSNF